MRQYFIVPPCRSRRSWDVHIFSARGKWIGTHFCDGEEIAKLVMKRLKMGVNPGWAARDVRNGSDQAKSSNPKEVVAIYDPEKYLHTEDVEAKQVKGKPK